MSSINTSVPDVTITGSGLLAPTVSDILAGRLEDFKNILGAQPKIPLSSPQGQIATSDAAIISQKNNALLTLFSQINPDYATGRFQDGIGRLYFMERIPGIGTTVVVRCSGVVGVKIPSGSIVIDSSDRQYFSRADAFISDLGYVDVVFENSVNGAIPCNVGSVNRIVTPIDGWNSVTNLSAGVLGYEVEGRYAFEVRRRDSISRAGSNNDESVLGEILSVDGVVDAYVWSNRKSESVVIGNGTSVLPHSTYISVFGGADADIANAIFKKINPTADLNGNVTVTVYDKTNYQEPYPSYEISWQRATAARLRFRVSIDGTTLTPPSDIVSLVRTAVSNTLSGLYPGVDRSKIGSTVSVGKFFAPIIAVDPSTVSPLSIEVSLDGVNWLKSVTVGVDELPTVDPGDVEVTID